MCTNKYNCVIWTKQSDNISNYNYIDQNRAEKKQKHLPTHDVWTVTLQDCLNISIICSWQQVYYKILAHPSHILMTTISMYEYQFRHTITKNEVQIDHTNHTFTNHRGTTT